MFSFTDHLFLVFSFVLHNVLSLVEKKALSLILRENKLYFTLLIADSN